MHNSQAVSAAVAKLYNTYPYYSGLHSVMVHLRQQCAGSHFCCPHTAVEAITLSLTRLQAAVSDRQRYRLIELPDPQISHCEFYLARPPLPGIDWSNDTALLQAIRERNQCMDGWSSQAILDYKYQLVRLQETEYAFLEACDKANRQQTVEILMRETGIDLNRVRSLQNCQQILLTPTGLNQ